MPSWDITVNARFHPGLQLYSGKLVRHLDEESGGLLIPPAELPYEMTIPATPVRWSCGFQNVDAGGCRAWDSRSGENYWFQVAPGTTTIPVRSVAMRADAVQSRDVVNVVGEGAVKSNTFPGRAGQAPPRDAPGGGGLGPEPCLRQVPMAGRPRLRRIRQPPRVAERAPRVPGPRSGGGDLFRGRPRHLPRVGGDPGLGLSRPEARKVQYRLYCDMNGKTFTDGVLHQHELSEDVVH